MKVKSLWDSIILAAILLTVEGIASIDIQTSEVNIYAVNQNPVGRDEGNE